MEGCLEESETRNQKYQVVEGRGPWEDNSINLTRYLGKNERGPGKEAWA